MFELLAGQPCAGTRELSTACLDALQRVLTYPKLFDEDTRVQVLNLSEAVIPAVSDRVDLLLKLAGALDADSYALKNSAACAVKKFPLFAEKAEIQLGDADLVSLLK